MRISFEPEDVLKLKSALDLCEDAEVVGPDEYVVDVYDLDPPVSLELGFDRKGVNVLAAEKLAFDEELDGWYLAGPITDETLLTKVLRTLLC